MDAFKNALASVCIIKKVQNIANELRGITKLLSGKLSDEHLYYGTRVTNYRSRSSGRSELFSNLILN